MSDEVVIRPVDSHRSVMHLAWKCWACGRWVDVARATCACGEWKP